MDEKTVKQIDAAVASFRTLLEEQYERTESMKNPPPAKDFATAGKIRIGIVNGDGIGPFIVKEAERVMRRLLEPDISGGRVEIVPVEGLTIENRTACGCSVPQDVLEKIKTCDVLLKGPTTTPKGGTMESANVTLRRELDLYANVRPVSVPEEGIDWTFFRENTEGEYVLGSRGIRIEESLAMDFRVCTEAGTRRIARAAFEYAKKTGKTKVAIVTKANILKKTDGMFSELCHEVAADYPGIDADDWYIDIMTANLVNPAVRSGFQVFVLPNLYGDIITDEAAQIQGGVGTAGSANIGDRYAMFEAIHGSAPRLIEEGLGAYADPTSILRALEMLLRHICRASEAEALARALDVCSASSSVPKANGTRGGATCREFADCVLFAIDSSNSFPV